MLNGRTIERARWGSLVRIVAISFAVVITCSSCAILWPEPSQQDLAHMLAARKNAFEKFIQLINRPPNIVHIGPGVDRLEVWTMTGDIEAYDTRFPTIECMVDELGIKSLRSKNGEVDLWLWDDPMGFRGPSKGIAYSRKPVAPLYESVDDPARMSPVFIAKDPDLIYARIAPNWYAFYDFAQE